MKEQTRFHLVNDAVCIRLMLHGKEIQDLLERNNWVETADIGEADVILVNTCAFLKNAEDKAVSRIERIIAAKKPCQEVVVFGCLPGINPERLAAIHQGSVVAGRDLAEVVRLFGLKRAEGRIGHVVARPGDWRVRLIRSLNRLVIRDDYFTYLYDKERVYHLKIAEGCLGQCSYCAERIVRGTLRSKRVAEVLSEFGRGLDLGYRIFSLNADDVGMFGQDRGENVADLIERLLEVDRDFRLVLTEFNPAALVRYEDRLVAALASPKIVFVTVPIESGDQRVLNAMRRPYAIDRVRAALDRVRAANPRLKINTHLIVGFPGETPEEFQATARLVEEFGFNKVKVFAYSDRGGTVASLMPGKIPEEEKQRRRGVLLDLVRRRAFRGRDWKALILNRVGFAND